MKSPGKHVLLDLHQQILDEEDGDQFVDAYQLLKDFFEDVDKTLSLVRDK